MTDDESTDDAPELADIDPRSMPVRISRLKLMALSPAHYREACRYPDRPGSSAMKLGSAADAIAFDKPIAIWDRVTKSGRSAPRSGMGWDEFRHEHAGKVILSSTEYRNATAMVDALRSDPHATPLLFGPDVRRDVEISWTYMGRACVSHLDALTPVAVVDLKTSRSAQPDRFVRQAMWLAYHAQMAFYDDAARSIGLRVPSSIIVAVESSRPHPVTVFRLRLDALDAGRRLYQSWFEKLLICEESNVWPGYSQSVVDFELPPGEAYSLLDSDENVDPEEL